VLGSAVSGERSDRTKTDRRERLPGFVLMGMLPFTSMPKAMLIGLGKILSVADRNRLLPLPIPFNWRLCLQQKRTAGNGPQESFQQ